MAYDPQKANLVIEIMGEEKLSTVKACEKAGVKRTTFLLWCDIDKDLADRYARTRDDVIEFIAEETIRIADEPIPSTATGGLDSAAVAKQRLQVDTRKWLLSKLAPKKYGDRQHVEHSGGITLERLVAGDEE